jgi:N-acetylmuramoyl-L-alanine amidase
MTADFSNNPSQRLHIQRLYIWTAMIFVFMAFVCTPFQASAQPLSIEKIRSATHPDKTRIVLDLNRSAEFRTFTLKDPYRLVIDLPQFEWRAAGLEKDRQSVISGMRQGSLEAGISRIVLDMARPLSIQAAFILPKDGALPNRLVVDLIPVSAELFNRNMEQSFGTLSLNAGFLSAPAQTPDSSPRFEQQNQAAAAPSSQRIQGKMPVIVIDPGHGGVDPGAVGANGVHEKNVVLNLSRALRDELQKTGRYRVLMTRDSDVFIRLSDRVRFARTNNADLFVSVHADSMPKANVRGASIYTISDQASDEQTARLAARENKADLIAGLDLSVEDEDVANILVNLAMRDTMNQSKYFANTVVTTFNEKGLRLLERPHRYAGFAVLKAPDVPSVLVEAGFMSNRAEADMLTTPEFAQRFAVSMTRAIDTYFKTVAENEND